MSQYLSVLSQLPVTSKFTSATHASCRIGASCAATCEHKRQRAQEMVKAPLVAAASSSGEEVCAGAEKADGPQQLISASSS